MSASATVDVAIRFTVPAIPVAQPRQRHSLFGGHVRNYTPTKHPVNAFKAAVQMAAATAFRGAPLAGPLRVDLVFVFPRPKAKCWKTRPMPREPHVGRPDVDNLFKSLADALTGAGLWRDDSQVCSSRIEKWVAAGDEQPHVEVVIGAAAQGEWLG